MLLWRNLWLIWIFFSLEFTYSYSVSFQKILSFSLKFNNFTIHASLLTLCHFFQIHGFSFQYQNFNFTSEKFSYIISLFVLFHCIYFFIEFSSSGLCFACLLHQLFYFKSFSLILFTYFSFLISVFHIPCYISCSTDSLVLLSILSSLCYDVFSFPSTSFLIITMTITTTSLYF